MGIDIQDRIEIALDHPGYVHILFLMFRCPPLEEFFVIRPFGESV
jgi:hypothetical protein